MSGARVLGGKRTPGSRDWEASLLGRPGAAVSVTGQTPQGCTGHQLKQEARPPQAPVGTGGSLGCRGARGVVGETEALVSCRGDRVWNGVSLLLPQGARGTEAR